ncbi:glutathione S-transferase [Flavimaribacter sediminis]|nr:glutathione S-transferase [Flavimaribacter sediminis]
MTMMRADFAQLPVLYSFRRCPYAMRARLALRSAGITVELREVVLKDKAPEFLAASPSATVPCLVLPGAPAIDESLDIMVWSLRQSDPEDLLDPPIGTLDDMLDLIAELDGPFKRSLDRYKYETRFSDADPVEERNKAGRFLEKLDALLKGRPWLFGDRPSLADLASLPFVRQFANVDREWFDGQDWPDLIGWLDRFLESRRFSAIMTRYPKWKAGDPTTLFAA